VVEYRLFRIAAPNAPALPIAAAQEAL